MPAHVYILKDDNGKYYVGSTNDFTRRIKQHDQKHTFTTRRMKNPKLVFSQEYPTLVAARNIEYRIKKLKRKDYIDKIVHDGFIKIDL
jgi:predicted GIY-YIG superfamily endonuclease